MCANEAALRDVRDAFHIDGAGEIDGVAQCNVQSSECYRLALIYIPSICEICELADVRHDDCVGPRPSRKQSEGCHGIGLYRDNVSIERKANGNDSRYHGTDWSRHPKL